MKHLKQQRWDQVMIYAMSSFGLEKNFKKSL